MSYFHKTYFGLCHLTTSVMVLLFHKTLSPSQSRNNYKYDN
jgi:hypothetical protein